MKKNKKHKQFIKELKQHTSCTITPDDIYNNTDFFNDQPKQQKNLYKLSFIVSSILILI